MTFNELKKTAKLAVLAIHQIKEKNVMILLVSVILLADTNKIKTLVIIPRQCVSLSSRLPFQFSACKRLCQIATY